MGAQSATAPIPPARATTLNSRRPTGIPMEERFGEQVRLGVLTRWITPQLVDEVLERTGRIELRRRLLPARAVVYFVLALCLFGSAESAGQPGYRAVLRTLTETLRHLPGLRLQRLPTSSALTRARQRLGEKPLRVLFERTCGPLAGPDTAGAYAFGLRLVAWDGTSLDVPETEANATAFGYTNPSTNTCGNPQVRLMTVTECGTHGLIDAAFEGVEHSSEFTLGRALLASLAPDMLLLADRYFVGYELWADVRATGAQLIWRVKAGQFFTPLRVLPDGSYLSVMPTPAETRRLGAARATGHPTTEMPQGHLVRIVDYSVRVRSADGAISRESFRLVTSLLDHRQAPAQQLAMVYHQRWEIEISFAELKNRLRGAGFTLRSKSPDLVCQEVYALLVVYHALCALECEVASEAGIDSDRISFTVTVQLVRLGVPRQAAATTNRLRWALETVAADLLDDLLPSRRDRRCDRVKKPPKNKFAIKRRDRPRTPSNVHYTINVTRQRPSPAETA
ncbi:IS4 family transposase [Streptomyces sp. H10-C2]|uniref:IS4 family transposase n=1 Tax=unclassified Streptomyces TaxID=2593676 RepID=UPI0024B97BAE|nr:MULTISPECIES: IS4 family transposase [unclassified Streptomyces]MDJ0347658.1 IS4 family transposase [Streptomyces sp. PH10-H1]MDJ0375826.1 IS4 family transposase [Streptomyces sp. H10-C2]